MQKMKAKLGGKNHASELQPPTGQDGDNTQKPLPSEPPPDESTQDRSAPNGGPSSTNDNSDPEGCLHAHNSARSAKGCQELAWDPDLARDAAAYAQRLADKDRMEHAGVQGQGENLYMSTGDARFEQAVRSWLEEEQKYGGERVGEGNFMEWGHFGTFMLLARLHVALGSMMSCLANDRGYSSVSVA